MTDETTAESALESKAESKPTPTDPNWRVLAGRKRASQPSFKGMASLGGKASHGGGKKPKPTKCRRCGAKCASARLAWNHCKGAARKKRKDAKPPAQKQESVRPRGRPKGSGLGHYTPRKFVW